MYEEKIFMLDVYNKISVPEEQSAEGKVIDCDALLKNRERSIIYKLVISELAHQDLDHIVS